MYSSLELCRRLLQDEGFSEVQPLTAPELSKSLVFKAFRGDVGWVAIKVPKWQRITVSKQMVENVIREAKIWRSLSHPHIAVVKDVLVLANGLPAIVIEYCPSTLRDVLEAKGKLDVNEALSIAIKCAKALVHAHGQGVYHCDIKPENVLITEDGEPKISDFGTARVFLSSAPSTVFTPEYAAPEQLQEEGEVSDKTDVYQLAMVIREMVTGGRDLELPDPLRAVLESCFETVPEKRPSMSQMLNMLKSISEQTMEATSQTALQTEQVIAPAPTSKTLDQKFKEFMGYLLEFMGYLLNGILVFGFPIGLVGAKLSAWYLPPSNGFPNGLTLLFAVIAFFSAITLLELIGEGAQEYCKGVRVICIPVGIAVFFIGLWCMFSFWDTAEIMGILPEFVGIMLFITFAGLSIIWGAATACEKSKQAGQSKSRPSPPRPVVLLILVIIAVSLPLLIMIIVAGQIDKGIVIVEAKAWKSYHPARTYFCVSFKVKNMGKSPVTGLTVSTAPVDVPLRFNDTTLLPGRSDSDYNCVAVPTKSAGGVDRLTIKVSGNVPGGRTVDKVTVPVE